MRGPGRAGLVPVANAASFAPARNHQQGNDLPPDSGMWAPTQPGPSPSSPGYVIDGSLGGNDGAWGPDPRFPVYQPPPYFLPGSDPAGMDSGTANNPGAYRGGLQGFNDKLTVKDRHALWLTGYQRQGTDFSPASSPPNTFNDPQQTPPQARLATVNRTVSYQKGTDTSRNQDDLSRPYTWLGEQGSGWSPVYGGVPGLFQPYGSRGGVPYPIHDPTDGKGGRELVWSGPPHGLHSQTFPDTADTLRRYDALPQMRPVRIDRPSNSPQAGQSFSQTVQFQGTTEGASQPGGAPDTLPPWTGRAGTRGWAGARRPPGKGS